MRTPSLGLQVEILAYNIGLDLIHPAFEAPVDIGYSDLAHWIPWTLRVEEVERFCAAVSVEPATECPEAISRILLSLFTLPDATTSTRQKDAMHRALAQVGYGQVEAESLERGAFHTNAFGQPRKGVSWAKVGDRWCVVGEPNYSYRADDKPSFPHAELSEVLG
jgi:hypothetical protein